MTDIARVVSAAKDVSKKASDDDAIVIIDDARSAISRLVWVACHEQAFGLPLGKLKARRMVPLRACVKESSAANIEFVGRAA